MKRQKPVQSYRVRVSPEGESVTSYVTIEGETFFAARAALAVRWRVDPLVIRLAKPAGAR